MLQNLFKKIEDKKKKKKIEDCQKGKSLLLKFTFLNYFWVPVPLQNLLKVILSPRNAQSFRIFHSVKLWDPKWACTLSIVSS